MNWRVIAFGATQFCVGCAYTRQDWIAMAVFFVIGCLVFPKVRADEGYWKAICNAWHAAKREFKREFRKTRRWQQADAEF